MVASLGALVGLARFSGAAAATGEWVLGMTTENERSEFDQGLTAALAEGGAWAAQHICELCVNALPVTGAAITAMTSPDHQSPVWATDAVAQRIDELQFRLAEGPCVEAFTSGVPVLVTDIAEGVDESGRCSRPRPCGRPWRGGCMSSRCSAGRSASGCSTSTGTDPWCSDPTTWLARGAPRTPRSGRCWTCAPERRSTRPEFPRPPPATGDVEVDVEGWLADVPLERVEVYQASGMIIAQLDVSPDAALATLRAHAFVHDRPIDEVARDVVARTLRFTTER